jgi:hypothetical protein
MKKGKAKEVCFFAQLNGGLGIPIQHFAGTTGDFFYHNASGFAERGTVEGMDIGLDFPKDNCAVSLKTFYGSNEFRMDSYLKYLQNPDWNFYHPGGNGITYTSISGGIYKYISFLFKVETEIPVKKFSFGFYCAAGSSKLISFPDVKVAMDSASNHIETGFAAREGSHYGISLNYGAAATLHIGSHFYIKAIADYFYSHFVFDLNIISPQQNGSVWYAKTEPPTHYSYPFTLLNLSLGTGCRF